MSSIAYITDHEMIEYHRLHGNTTIAFWRPSSQKKFANFHYGDYLFFLTKGTEKGKEREKGIIGYGRFIKEDSQSVHQLWKKYQTDCGYANEDLFQEAVLKLSKTHVCPKRMQCLILTNVNYFQTPVYLSELDQKISKQVESYVYLDQTGFDSSWHIIHQALKYGTDLWSTYVEQMGYTMRQDADIALIQSMHERVQCELYSEYEKKKTMQFANKQIEKATGNFLSGGCDDFLLLKQREVCFYLPCVLSLKTWKRNLLQCIGKAHLYQSALKEKQSTSLVSIMMDQNNEEAIMLCEQANIPYQIQAT